jgi:hypothetical protein
VKTTEFHTAGVQMSYRVVSEPQPHNWTDISDGWILELLAVSFPGSQSVEDYRRYIDGRH